MKKSWKISFIKALSIVVVVLLNQATLADEACKKTVEKWKTLDKKVTTAYSEVRNMADQLNKVTLEGDTKAANKLAKKADKAYSNYLKALKKADKARNDIRDKCPAECDIAIDTVDELAREIQQIALEHNGLRSIQIGLLDEWMESGWFGKNCPDVPEDEQERCFEIVQQNEELKPRMFATMRQLFSLENDMESLEEEMEEICSDEE